MKKTLIALAVLGAAAGVAHAQSNVTIYGVVDTGYIKESGSDLRMGDNIDSRIGFKGAEDLGGGLKAIFQLEKRFNVNDGTNNSAANKDWEGAANVGLVSADWGKIRFGRVNELSTETIRKFDPFYQYGVGSMITSTQRSEHIDNTVRYDSPKWEGVSVGLSYSLGRDTKDGGINDITDKPWYKSDGKSIDNDGYAINLSYDNGPWMATANWSRLADSADSDVWNLGVSYKFGDARVMLSYEKTTDEGYHGGDGTRWSSSALKTSKFAGTHNYLGTEFTPLKSEQESWLLGLEWDIGPGQFDASVQRVSLDDVRQVSDGARALYDGKKMEGDLMQYAVGYTYNLSKRTSVYGQVAYIDWDTEGVGYFYSGDERESTTQVQIGITHKF